MTAYERRERENTKRRERGIAKVQELVAKGYTLEQAGRYGWTWYGFTYGIEGNVLRLQIWNPGKSATTIAEISN